LTFGRSGAQCARISKIENGGLDQYGAEPFEQHQFETAGVEGVKLTSFNALTTQYFRSWF